MSELPNGWAAVTVSDLTSEGEVGILTGPFGSNLGREDFRDVGVPVLTIGCLSEDGIKRSKLLHIDVNKATELSAYKLREGDFLFSRMATVGRAGFVPGDLAGAIFNYHLMRLRLDERRVQPRYFFHYVRGAEAVKSYLDEVSRGATRDGINTKLLGSMPVQLAPLPEQRRIVAKLDSLRARSARAREELDRIPKLIERYKQAILAKAFSGELTADWRETNTLKASPQELRDKVAAERERRRISEKVRGSGANRSIPTASAGLPTIPESWVWLTFDGCSWDLTVGHVGPMKDQYVAEGVPFLRSLNIKANSISVADLVFIPEVFHRELRKSQLTAGTVVVVRTGEPGIAAVVPSHLHGANCSDLVICRPVESLNPYYAAMYINSSFAKEFVGNNQVGVAQQHFNVGAMGQLPVPFAPPEEQFAIVRRIEHAFAWLDKIAAEHAGAARLLPKLDQAILAKAFRGELVPQDPNDEPASALLERIKVERAAKPAGKRRGRKGTST